MEQGSYEPIERDAEFFFKLEGLFTYDQDIGSEDFIDKYSLEGTTVSPFHTFVRINSPAGVKYAFYANMTCISESQVYDPIYGDTWVSTTWSLNSSVEAMVANAMVNRTKAVTGGRDGHDSNNWFFKESLYD